MQPALKLATVAFALAASGATADVLLSDAYSFAGGICVGDDCLSSESLTGRDFQIKTITPAIWVEDTSVQGSNYPSDDWKFNFNENSAFGQSLFSIQNYSRATVPFEIAGFAYDRSLTIGEGALSGEARVGIGTRFPETELHVTSPVLPIIRIEQLDFPFNPPQVWDLAGNSTGFDIRNHSDGTYPFRIDTEAPDLTMFLGEDGKIGLGTFNPSTALHLTRDNGKAKAFVEETASYQMPRTLLDLRNNGRAELTLGNAADDVEWSLGGGNNFVMKFGAVGSREPVKKKRLTLFSGSGNLKIEGQIITGGPTCAAGCDAVFSDGYDLPSIVEHAARMYALGHLPNVGPTGAERAVNLTDQMGRILNELEHAHIYIAELERRLAALETAARP